MEKEKTHKRKLIVAIIAMLLFYLLSFVISGFYIYKTILPFYKELQMQNDNFAKFNSYITLVNKYDKDGKYDDELDVAKKAVKVADNDADKAQAYYAMGNAYFSLKDYDNAVIYAKKSIKLDSENSFAYNTLAQVSLEKKDYKNALEYSKKFVLIQPNSSLGYQNLAFANYYLGNKDLAIKNIDQAIKLDPKDKNLTDTKAFFQGNSVTTSTTTVTAADINPEDKDPNYWKTQLGYMNDDETNIGKITGDSRYDQAKLAQAKNMLYERRNIINPIYAKLQAGQALNNADAVALDRYWTITGTYYALADQILHPGN